MTTIDAQRCLDTAHDMLTAGSQNGWWPRACACLIRLALESGIDDYWQRVRPPVAACASRRAKLLMLRQGRTRALAQRAAYAWVALSRAAHHHCYELAPTATEIRHLHTEVTSILADLRAQAPSPR